MHVMSLSPFVPRLRGLGELSQLIEARELADLSGLRAKHKIAVIDDDKAEGIHIALPRHGYNVSYYRSAEDLGRPSGYSLFICDINGVDTNSRFDGAFTIKQVRQALPLSYIVCHSGVSPNDIRLREARRYSDVVLHKRSTDIAVVLESIDEGLLELSSPVRFWKRLRSRLFDIGVSTGEIAILEHYWVAAVCSGRQEIFDRALENLGRERKLPVGEIARSSAKLAIELGSLALKAGAANA